MEIIQCWKDILFKMKKQFIWRLGLIIFLFLFAMYVAVKIILWLNNLIF